MRENDAPSNTFLIGDLKFRHRSVAEDLGLDDLGVLILPDLEDYCLEDLEVGKPAGNVAYDRVATDRQRLQALDAMDLDGHWLGSGP